MFIATESAEGRYTLRQFDVRNRERKAAQNVELEPFVDTTDRAAMDVNSLSLSSDGLYIAAGRTDNWADVYDARMLERGPLHSFAHEGAVAPDTYGVVKTEWVDGSPHGVGLVTGGIDGESARAVSRVDVVGTGRMLTMQDAQVAYGYGTSGTRPTTR